LVPYGYRYNNLRNTGSEQNMSQIRIKARVTTILVRKYCTCFKKTGRVRKMEWRGLGRDIFTF
jgi:hypothetical protein